MALWLKWSFGLMSRTVLVEFIGALVHVFDHKELDSLFLALLLLQHLPFAHLPQLVQLLQSLVEQPHFMLAPPLSPYSQSALLLSQHPPNQLYLHAFGQTFLIAYFRFFSPLIQLFSLTFSLFQPPLLSMLSLLLFWLLTFTLNQTLYFWKIFILNPSLFYCLRSHSLVSFPSTYTLMAGFTRAIFRFFLLLALLVSIIATYFILLLYLYTLLFFPHYFAQSFNRTWQHIFILIAVSNQPFFLYHLARIHFS